MTDNDLFAEYLTREKAANAKKEGADMRAICADLARENGLPEEHVINVVIEQTVAAMGGAG